MKMKNVASGKIYAIAQIFRNDKGYFRVLYFDPEVGSSGKPKASISLFQ